MLARPAILFVNKTYPQNPPFQQKPLLLCHEDLPVLFAVDLRLERRLM